MANTRISNLTASASNLASTDLAPVVQTVGVGPVKMTGQQLAGGLLGSATFNNATVTTSQPVLNLTQTWNAGAVTFTGLLFNAAGASGTNSASGSLLLDLQVGGASQFSVDKIGNVVAGKSYKVYAAGAFECFTASNLATRTFYVFDGGGSNPVMAFGANGSIQWSSTTAAGSSDLYLRRAAAATLQLGAADAAAPVAQTFKVQGVVAGTSNTAGANFTIQGSQSTGTGAGGSIIFQVAPAGSSGTAQNAYATFASINADKTIVLGGGDNAAKVNINCEGIYANTGAGTNKALVSQYGIRMTSDLALSWSSTTNNPNSVIDTFLYRDAANTLALRNGGTSGSPVPQTFRVYNWGDATNGEFGAMTFSSNTFRIISGKNGTGTDRPLQFFSASGNVDVIDGASTSQINFNTASGNGLRVASDRPIGFTSGAANGSGPDTTLRRVAAGILGVRGGAITDAGALSFIEQTAPTAPAANGVYIYAEDNGSGKTRLMALFNTGAAQQIAIEP